MMRPFRLRPRRSSAFTSGMRISQKTRASRTRRAISWVYCPPKSTTPTSSWVMSKRRFSGGTSAAELLGKRHSKVAFEQFQEAGEIRYLEGRLRGPLHGRVAPAAVHEDGDEARPVGPVDVLHG